MSLDLSILENQIVGGNSIIYQKHQNDKAFFDESVCYENTVIKNLYMVIQKLPIDNDDETIQGYYSIAFLTPNHKYPVDALDVVIDNSATYLRFLGNEIKTGDSKTNTVMNTNEYLTWVKTLVAANIELVDMLRKHVEFTDGNKSNRK